MFDGEYENPVSPEDIVGIPKEDIDKDEDEGRIKSPDLKIPEGVIKSFDNIYRPIGLEISKEGRYEDEKEVVDSNKLFFAREENEPLVGGPVNRRTYYRYQEVGQDRDDGTIGIFRQNELTVYKAGSWTIRRDDLSPGMNRNRAWLLKDSSAAFLSKNEDSLLELDRVIEKHQLLVAYRPDGALAYVAINDSGDEALEEDHPHYGQRDLHAEILRLRGNVEGRMNIEVPDLGVGQRVIDGVKEFDARARERIQLAETVDELKIVVYRYNNPSQVDFELTIPKRQEMVEYETGTSIDYRYAWEEDLIPELIRKDPIHAPMELDEAWKRADLAATIGVKIEKSVVP